MDRNALVIHPGTLGDVLLAVPAIRALRDHAPSMRMVLMSAGEVGRLLRECGEIDEVLAIEGPEMAALLTGTVSLEPRLMSCLRRCSSVVYWGTDPHREIEAQLKRAGVEAIIACSPHDAALGAAHQADRFFETIAPLGVRRPREQVLRLPGALQQRGDHWLEQMGLSPTVPFVLIHPGSGSPHKCVAPRLLVDLIRACDDDGVRAVIIAGPADGAQLDALAGMMTTLPPVCRDVDLATAAAIVSRAAVFVGHDSGLTHLASAVGTTTVALFGPTDPDRWRPKGRGVTVLRGPACQCVDWARVRTCAEKRCLHIEPTALISACRAVVAVRSDPGIPLY